MDVFDSLMMPYGGRLREAHVLHPTAWAEFSLIKGFLQLWLDIDQKTCLSRNQWRNSSLGIECDLLASLEVNALATANTRLEAVGLNAGLVAFLENAFYALLCSNCFLPTVGDTTNCHPPDVIAKNIATADIRKGWGTYSPRDKARKRLAFILSRFSELFVLFHEISHIGYGHLLHDEIQKEDGVATIFEYRPSSESINHRLLQTMEFDADEGAVAASITHALKIFESSHFASLFGTATEAEVIRYWTLSVTVLFRILDLFTKSATLDVVSTHPAPGPRTDHALYCGRGWIGTMYPALLETYDVEIRLAASHVSDVWKALGLPAVSHEIDPRRRYEFVRSLRADLRRFDGQILDHLLRRRAKLVQERFGSI